METSKNHLIRNFIRNGRVRVKESSTINNFVLRWSIQLGDILKNNFELRQRDKNYTIIYKSSLVRAKLQLGQRPSGEIRESRNSVEDSVRLRDFTELTEESTAKMFQIELIDSIKQPCVFPLHFQQFSEVQSHLSQKLFLINKKKNFWKLLRMEHP